VEIQLHRVQGAELADRSSGLSPLLRDFLAIMVYTSLFHDQADAQSILLWNLGPHGFDKSGLHIDRIFSENRFVVCLQDLRIPLHRKEEIRSDLERRFPYKVFICAYQHRSTPRHRNSGYMFSTLTALHTGVFISASSSS
jgi:transposase